MQFTNDELQLLLDVLTVLDERNLSNKERSALHSMKNRIQSALSPVDNEQRIVEESIDEA